MGFGSFLATNGNTVFNNNSASGFGGENARIWQAVLLMFSLVSYCVLAYHSPDTHQSTPVHHGEFVSFLGDPINTYIPLNPLGNHYLYTPTPAWIKSHSDSGDRDREYFYLVKYP